MKAEYEDIKKDLKSRMDSSLKSLEHDLVGLRTGRASVSFLDSVQVDAYGSKTKINQVGSVSTPDARTILVQVWDKGLVKAVEKGIVEANLGVSPLTDGQNIRINLPSINEERRKELVKLSHKYCENSKVSIRNVRRDCMDDLKKLEKDKIISEDELHRFGIELQKITDEYIAKADIDTKNKEQEILKL